MRRRPRILFWFAVGLAMAGTSAFLFLSAPTSGPTELSVGHQPPNAAVAPAPSTIPADGTRPEAVSNAALGPPATGPIMPVVPSAGFRSECRPNELQVSSYGHPAVVNGRVVINTAEPLNTVDEAIGIFTSTRPNTWEGSRTPPFRWTTDPLPNRGPHDKILRAYLGQRAMVYIELVVDETNHYYIETEEYCVDYVKPDTRLPCDPNCPPRGKP